MRAEDQKLKINLEWPKYESTRSRSVNSHVSFSQNTHKGVRVLQGFYHTTAGGWLARLATAVLSWLEAVSYCHYYMYIHVHDSLVPRLHSPAFHRIAFIHGVIKKLGSGICERG